MKNYNTTKDMTDFMDDVLEVLKTDETELEELNRARKFVIRQCIRVEKIVNAIFGWADNKYPAKRYRKLLNVYLAIYKL